MNQPTETTPENRPSHAGGCPCEICEGERVELDRCLAILAPELRGAR